MTDEELDTLMLLAEEVPEEVTPAQWAFLASFAPVAAIQLEAQG